MQAVVLLSGGIDSTTALMMAVDAHGKEQVVGLTIDYGQKHRIETEKARAIAEHVGVLRRHVRVDPSVFLGAGSAIVGGGEVEMPHLTYQEIAEGEGPSPTYVPFRNANLISIATAVALGVGASEVWYGAHAEDARGWAYPDCTPEFNGAMAAAVYIGSYHNVRLIVPLQWMMKAEIVKAGYNLLAPFELTLSCYEGREPACGKCPTCVERLQAFEANNLVDPIPYQAWPKRSE